MTSFLTSMMLAVVAYVSPVHFDVLLSGNFGEPRPNHFHGGIDIKTQQTEGKAVYAIGDGYVCRVSVSAQGHGNTVYVRHPDGYTSVYAHLQRFAPFIEAKVRQFQYSNKTTDADIILEARECPVAQGQLIALSGDTGASMGPHLHLEIFQTDNGHLMDPLAFIPELLKDSMPPVADAIMAYPQPGKGMFCGKNTPQRFDLSEGAITDSLFAWGKVGFGLLAYDQMEGSANKLGVRFTRFLVDDKEVFSSDVDNIPLSDNKLVNIWGDYNYFIRQQEWFLKSFVEQGNTLSIIKTNNEKGVVDFNEERPYRLSYVLSDFFGNQQQFSFTVIGRREEVAPIEETADSLHFNRDMENRIDADDVTLSVPKGGMLFDAKVKTAQRSSRRLSHEVSFARQSVPLAEAAQLRIRLRKEVPDTNKIYVAARKFNARNPLDFDNETFVKARVDGEWVECSIRDIGEAFVVAYDDTPPHITPVAERSWEDQQTICVDIRDSASGLDGVEGYVDGQFVLFEYVKKSSHMVCNLRQTPIAPTGGERLLSVTARDRCGNATTYETTIIY